MGKILQSVLLHRPQGTKNFVNFKKSLNQKYMRVIHLLLRQFSYREPDNHIMYEEITNIFQQLVSEKQQTIAFNINNNIKYNGIFYSLFIKYLTFTTNDTRKMLLRLLKKDYILIPKTKSKPTKKKKKIIKKRISIYGDIISQIVFYCEPETLQSLAFVDKLYSNEARRRIFSKINLECESSLLLLVIALQSNEEYRKKHPVKTLINFF
jgi:hypothetical protein